MSAISLLRRSSCSAIARYRGQSFYSQDARKLIADLKAWGVQSDATPDVDTRSGGRAVKSTWTNIGRWTNADLAVTHPYASFTKGQLNTPVRKITAVTAADDVVTVVNHRQITGTGVVVVSTGTVPGGLVSNTLYYLVVVDEDTLSFATTEANATAEEPVVIDLTSAGTGTIKIVQNSPLDINYLDEDKTQLRLWNSAVSKMPSLILRPTKTMFGDLEFTSYGRHGMDTSDDNSLFTIGTWAGEPDVVDPADIPSVKYTAQFGNAAPFNNLAPREGVQIDFAMDTTELLDNDEVVAHRIGNVSATAKLLPLNLTAGDLWGELALQGIGAGLGKSLPKDTLSLFGPDSSPYIALYGAQLQDGGLVVGSKEDPIDVVTFKTSQTFTEGVTNPVFYLGEEAPE